MTNRREFVQAGAAVGLAAGMRLGGQASASEEPSITLYKVVYDERFGDSVAFGHEAGRLGFATAAIRRDVTPLWLDDLSARWSDTRDAVAGLTDAGSLFVLERFAWEHGMGVVYRGDHAKRGGAIEHVFSAADQAPFRAEDFKSAEWAPPTARFVANYPLTAQAQSRKSPRPFPRLKTVSGAPSSADMGEAGFLVSWIIAPLGKNA